MISLIHTDTSDTRRLLEERSYSPSNYGTASHLSNNSDQPHRQLKSLRDRLNCPHLLSRAAFWKRGKKPPPNRRIDINTTQTNTKTFCSNRTRYTNFIYNIHHLVCGYEGNYIFLFSICSTTKYNPLTFIPYFLYDQFRRYANLFFLVIALLQVKKTLYLILMISVVHLNSKYQGYPQLVDILLSLHCC